MSAMRVLLVDDEEDLRSAMASTLEEEGYVVTQAGSVGEAERVFMESPCWAVVTDLRLPDGTGIELLRRLRARNSSFVAIVATGFGAFEHAVDAIALRVVRFLSKPFSITDLLGALAEAREAAAAEPQTANDRICGLSADSDVLCAELGKALAALALDERTARDAHRLGCEAIRNACRHAYPLEPGKVEVRCALERDSLRISVRDHGCGFDVAEELAHSLARRTAEGASGLFAFHRDADEIQLSSSPGKGTEVTLRFHAVRSASARTAAPCPDDLAVAMLWS